MAKSRHEMSYKLHEHGENRTIVRIKTRVSRVLAGATALTLRARFR